MKPWRSWPITLRLSVLFAALAALTFAVVGTVLYQSLATRLRQDDEREMLARARMVREFLAAAPTARSVSEGRHALVDAIFSNDGCVLAIDTLDGHTLLHTAPTRHPWPAQGTVSSSVAPQPSDMADWGQGRALRLRGTLGDGTPVLVSIGREHSDRAALLARYARTIAAAVVGGALLVAALGWAAVRQGLGALRTVTVQANAISAQHLAARLPVDELPRELRELASAFNAMAERLAEGVQRLSGFAADLAHDLRTPVNTLLVQTQVALARPRAPEEYRNLLASSIEEYERMARMIENTLFLARADHAQLAVQREMLDMQTELARIREYFEGMAEEAGVAVEVRAEHIAVAADPVLFRRAVNNLVSNAIRHTPRGGQVRLVAQQAQGAPEVVVENTGAGIAPEHLPHIFDRYYRADAARTAAGHSVGLGLSIVQAIMALHHGQVRAESDPDVATRFSLRFSAA